MAQSSPTKRLDFTRPTAGADELHKPEGHDPVPPVTQHAPGSPPAEAATLNLEEISLEGLKQLRAKIDEVILKRQEVAKRDVIDQIVDVVQRYGVSVEELVDALGGMKAKRKSPKPVHKYQDPQTGTTWSGRGKEPSWIRGKNREDFLISK